MRTSNVSDHDVVCACISAKKRGWTIKDNGNYYFHDVPEKGIGDIMDILMEREAV